MTAKKKFTIEARTMAGVRIYVLTCNNVPTGIAVREREKAVAHEREAGCNGYIQVNLMPKEKNDYKKPLAQKYPQAYAVMKQIQHLFPRDDIMAMTDADGEAWLKTINDLNRLDGHSFHEIADTIVWWRNNEFWRDTKQSVLCLRKKDKDGVQYFRIFKYKKEHDRPELTRKEQYIRSAVSTGLDTINKMFG